MASAGNIILNLPTGGRGPYRVAPQGTVFRALPSKALQNTAAVMGILKQAKDVADMVAPFLSREYQPPLQQGEIAAQQLKAAQEAAQQAKTQAAEIGAQPLPLAPGLGSTQQQLQQSLGVTPGGGLGPSVLQLAPDVAAQLPQAQLLQAPLPTGVEPMPDPGKFGFESPVPGMTLGGPSEQQYLAAEQLAKTGQAVAAAEQAVAESPQALPTFNTIADAETAIRSALMLGDFQTANRMLAGLRYSALTDIPLATEIGEIPAKQRRQKAIADMMKRLRMPSELTPVRAELQRGRQQASLLAIEARNKATEQRREAVAAANARQKAEIEARKAAVKAAAEAAKEAEKERQKGRVELEKERQKGRMALEGKRQKGRRRLEGTKAYYRKQERRLRNAKTPDQLEKVTRTSEGAMASAQRFISSYTDHPGRMPPQKTGEKQIDYNRRVAAWKSKTSQYKRALAKYASARIINARAKYMREWMLLNPGKPVPADRLSGEIPSEYYAPELSEPTPPTNQSSSSGATTSTPPSSPPPPAATTNAPSSPPNVVDETVNILKGN